MDALTGGALTLELRPAGAGVMDNEEEENAEADDASDAKKKKRKSSKATVSASAAERIERVIHARRPDGSLVARSLRQLSGGERRRVALALALAYADLASERCGVACVQLVLDEVLQHLDAEGIARVTSLLRALPKRTVLLTSQADSATAHLFDVVDKVVKGDVGSASSSARANRRRRRRRPIRRARVVQTRKSGITSKKTKVNRVDANAPAPHSSSSSS